MKSISVSLENKIRLSPGEKRLLELLPTEGKRINTGDLAKKFYAGKVEPFNSRLVVIGLVRNLQRKIKMVKGSPIYVHSTQRSGPYQIEVWKSNSK